MKMTEVERAAAMEEFDTLGKEASELESRLSAIYSRQRDIAGKIQTSVQYGVATFVPKEGMTETDIAAHVYASVNMVVRATERMTELREMMNSRHAVRFF
jgi:hypothetical protein